MRYPKIWIEVAKAETVRVDLKLLNQGLFLFTLTTTYDTIVKLEMPDSAQGDSECNFLSVLMTDLKSIRKGMRVMWDQ